MADPFSIVAGAVGLIDVSIKLAKFIKKTKEGTDSIDDDLQQLERDIEQLRDTSDLIRKTFEDDINQDEAARKTSGPATSSIWRAVSSALTDGRITLERMDSYLASVKGEEGASTLDRLRRHLRRVSKDEYIVKLQKRLGKDHQILQTCLATLNINVTRQSHAGTSQSIADLSKDVSAWTTKIEYLILSLDSNAESNESVQSIKKPLWVNEYFMIPGPVEPHFVGRDSQFIELKQAVDGFKKDRRTKRVVVYGLNGSGKTQFCCNFAQDYRPSFWGVFFIDATSSATVKVSWGKIARQARKAEQESNIKHWLSEQTNPWLLIIDNAGELPESPDPQKLIPESDSGVVIFTTRNHMLSSIGDLNLKFEGLEEDHSSTLLLKCAEPFRPTLPQTAKDICRKLGHLPLAIKHAGNAIKKGICSFEDCLDSFEQSLARVKKSITEGNRARAAGFDKNEYPQSPDPQTHDSTGIYATFEMVIPAASEEDWQMLQLLSFFQSQRFHLNILVKAIVNPRRQTRADKKVSATASTHDTHRRTWSRMFRDVLRRVYVAMEQRSELPALPLVFRSLRDADPKPVEFALRQVLSKLRELALLDQNENDGTYSMHSAVQWWIRASMSYKEKQVWCQAACNVLAFAILLPPVGIQDEDSELRRQTYPHIQYVIKQEEQLADELRERQEDRNRPWPKIVPSFNRARILRDAKFSIVFAECGMWKESKELMLGVDEYLVGAIGLDDPVSIRVRTFLSTAYWWLGKPDDSLRLQEELLAACQKSLGEEHVETLNVKDRLGTSLWQQGKFRRAKAYTEEAVAGFFKAYPSGHVDKSRALTSLGRVLGKLGDFDKAIELNNKALEGLEMAEREQKSHFSDQRLDVMEVLAMAKHDRVRYGKPCEDDLGEAELGQAKVLEQHVKKLGREHPKSLWALCNLARIKATKGGSDDLIEAEEMLSWGLPVAKHTIGSDHIGYLMGKAYLGWVLTLREQYDEAETMLSDVYKTHRARHGQSMHPDGLVAATLLLDCYRRQKKHHMTARLEKETLEGIRGLFGDVPRSPWEDHFVKQDAARSEEAEAGASQSADTASARAQSLSHAKLERIEGS